MLAVAAPLLAGVLLCGLGSGVIAGPDYDGAASLLNPLGDTLCCLGAVALASAPVIWWIVSRD
ncbi:hypothetical protein [Dactylosporangium salmoneum]|uniref:Uncharacterized protein n=1 Tax=Dactylosporangium salmoneum TaxID=53361 RepID=A0ABP5UIF0_9ACTN